MGLSGAGKIISVILR